MSRQELFKDWLINIYHENKEAANDYVQAINPACNGLIKYYFRVDDFDFYALDDVRIIWQYSEVLFSNREFQKFPRPGVYITALKRYREFMQLTSSNPMPMKPLSESLRREEFREYLCRKQYAEGTVGDYVSGINTCNEFLNDRGIRFNFYTEPLVSRIVIQARELLNMHDFELFNGARHNQCSSALKQYCLYLNVPLY